MELRLGRLDFFHVRVDTDNLPHTRLDFLLVAYRRTMNLALDEASLDCRNRAAEAAAPEAQELFWDAISEMSFEDVQEIYNGPDDAATRYFQEKMTPPLTERMPAERLVSLLNAFFDAMAPLFKQHGGVIDKLIGDAIMAIFVGDGEGEERESACNAVRAGLATPGAVGHVCRMTRPSEARTPARS